jgi:hypothetical protein
MRELPRTSPQIGIRSIRALNRGSCGQLCCSSVAAATCSSVAAERREALETSVAALLQLQLAALLQQRGGRHERPLLQLCYSCNLQLCCRGRRHYRPLLQLCYSCNLQLCCRGGRHARSPTNFAANAAAARVEVDGGASSGRRIKWMPLYTSSLRPHTLVA